MHQLLLLRHAQAEDFSPGGRDADRRLTAAGRRQAAQVAEFLSTHDLQPERVLCSTARRTRETAALVVPDAPVEHIPELYNCSAATIAEHLAETDPQTSCVLVVAHAPGIPSLAHDLADPERSDPDALAVIERGYPTATVTCFEVEQWEHLRGAFLTRARLSSP